MDVDNGAARDVARRNSLPLPDAAAEVDGSPERKEAKVGILFGGLGGMIS